MKRDWVIAAIAVLWTGWGGLYFSANLWRYSPNVEVTGTGNVWLMLFAFHSIWLGVLLFLQNLVWIKTRSIENEENAESWRRTHDLPDL